MQSSINVIKNSRVIKQGDKEITTSSKDATSEIMLEKRGAKRDGMESYENIASNIIDNARRESEKIISKAFIESEQAKAQAFKDGLEKGYSEGYEKGYNGAMETAREDAEKLRIMADDVLASAKGEYNQYLSDKEQHIKALVVSIAENILKREVENTDALNEMIFNSIKTERNISFYIIKSNSSHAASIKQQVESWKAKIAFQGDIFVIEDNFLDDGTAVIEKDTGKSIVSIAYGIEKITEVLKEKQI